MTATSYVLAAVLALGLAGTAAAASESPVAATSTITGDPAAAAAFEHAIELHGWSAGTLFDLGNAYASSNQPGPAILAYERAHLLAPRDHAISGNLERTREAAGISVTPRSRINAVLSTLSSDEWTWIAIASAMLACAGVVAFAWSIRGRTTRTLVIAGIITSALAMTAAVAVAPATNEAVVVHGEAARIAPTAVAETAFAAPEGENVRIEQRRGDFVYVRDGDRSGWIPSSAVERIIVSERQAAHT